MSVSQPKEPKNNNLNNEINPEQALGLVSLGLMKKLSDKGITDLNWLKEDEKYDLYELCLLYTSPSPRDLSTSRMPSSA